VKLLFDHCLNRRLLNRFPDDEVKTAAAMGWEELRNGQLLATAAAHHFQVLISTDKGLRHEQDLRALPLSVVVMRAKSNRLVDLLPLVPHVHSVLPTLEVVQLVEIDATGIIFRSRD
jgi:hypothetical protein